VIGCRTVKSYKLAAPASNGRGPSDAVRRDVRAKHEGLRRTLWQGSGDICSTLAAHSPAPQLLQRSPSTSRPVRIAAGLDGH
jgi:hypothetical protein